jgi:hypothetical protein
MPFPSDAGPTRSFDLFGSRRLFLLLVGSLGLLGVYGCSAGSPQSATATGGTDAGGGADATSGGTTSSGGGQQGGVTSAGGTASGGGSATGGSTSSGGTTGSGGAGRGGTTATGGTSSSGGGTATGGTGGGASGGATGSSGGESSAGGTNSGGSATGGTSSGGSATGGGGGTVSGEWKGATCATYGSTDVQSRFTTDYGTWKGAHVRECGTGLARVIGCQGDNNTCSEGMGYGMLLAVAAGDQTTFDAFNAFRKELAQINNAPDDSSGKVMAWLSLDTCPPTASGGNANSATDGDLDAAMSLVQAAARWPGGAYLDEAKEYVEAIWKNQVEKDGSGNPLRLKPGNLELSMDTRDYVSYYAPGYFHVFASVTGETKWNALADVFYTKLAEQQGKCTNGQVPDTFGATECKIWYDSCRAPWRIATDYGWFGDERAKTFLDALYAGSVQGKQASQWSDQSNSAMLGAFALSGVSSDDVTMQGLCDAWSSAQMDDNPYFQNTLRLLFLLTAGGLPISGIGS